MKTALISNIQHFNVHDGPGFRTIVFFQGCSLRCKWCQNPETIPMHPVILYNPELCIGCRACASACPNSAIKITEQAITTDYSKCTLCGTCADECYPLARTMSSRSMTVDEVFEEIMKEKRSYIISGGGITLSGGEPLLHIDFAKELLSRIKKEGVNTAVETAGNVPKEAFTELIPLIDTFLYDLKIYSSDKHSYWIGAGNELILDNLKYVSDVHDNVVIRIPLIPGINDTDTEFRLMMDFVSSLRKINSIHILPFHNLGANKYSLIGEKYEMEGFTEENEQRIQACSSIAGSYGFRVNVGGTGFLSDKKLMEGQTDGQKISL